MRATQREADRILDAVVRIPGRPDLFTRRLDRIVLHPVLGLVILLAVLFLMFQAVFTWAQAPMELIKSGFDALGAGAAAVLPEGWLLSFVRDGAISGVGSVIVFLPQILTLFLFILVLEDFGYMARAAFLMDRIMGGAGLHGRAFIPLLSSFACAIPGIMATRVISSRRDRLATILVAPLMTCSARIPVYTLIISAFVPRRSVLGWLSLQGLVMFGLYAAGIAGGARHVVGVQPFSVAARAERALHARTARLQAAETAEYRARAVAARPDLSAPSRHDDFRDDGRDLVFVLGAAGAARPAMLPSRRSITASPPASAKPSTRCCAPVGFNWQINIALIPGMAAREVAVASLGTVYAIEGADENRDALGSTLVAHWSLATALALLAWYVFAPQCASTLAVVRRETASWKWTAFLFGYMLALAYMAAFLVYHAAVWLGAG